MAKTVDYQVIPATTRPQDVVVDGKPLKFGTKTGAATVKDPGLAREIEAAYGKDGQKVPGSVVVVPRQTLGSCGTDGHRSFWGSMPEMPWKRREREMKNADFGSD